MRGELRTHTRWALAVILLVAVVGMNAARTAQAAPDEAKPTLSLIEARFGVEIKGIRRTAAGHMLDFRYRVIDAAKAAPLFVRKTKPVLIAQASGVELLVPVPPTIGPMRNSDPPIQGRTYFILFRNPDGFVKAGEKVTVAIGDFRVEDLEVIR